jgi:hypothetical protein
MEAANAEPAGAEFSRPQCNVCGERPKEFPSGRCLRCERIWQSVGSYSRSEIWHDMAEAGIPLSGKKVKGAPIRPVPSTPTAYQ